MKIPIIKHRKNVHGSVLVVGLVIASILGFTLASYLVLTQNQHRAMVRSATWGSSLALTEAGVEEALALINKYVGTPTELSTWTNSAVTLDGWTRSGNVFSKSNNVGSAIGGYTVYITNLLDSFNLPNKPAIYAEGSAVWNVADNSFLKPFYAAAGVQSQSTLSANAPVVRRVAVQTVRTPLFPVPKAAIGQINLRGNNIATDSFDSSDPNYSINGKYPTGNLSKTKDNGTVITLSTLIDSLNVGNADIKGKVKTGPNGTIAIGANGSVGSKAWVEGGNNGIEPGYSADDVNLDFPNAVLPSVSWTAMPSLPLIKPVINGVTYDLILTSGNYIASTLPGRTYVWPGAEVILRVTGSVSLSGTDRIDISTNASMAVYMGSTSGANVSFSTTGNGNINNLSQNALNFQLYGLPTCTSVSMGCNASYTGTIYAPQADITWGGGGSTTYDFVGASVGRTDTMNGHANFHYDENLARRGPSKGYVPSSWAEK